MTDDSSRNIESLMILLSATSTIEDEVERARLVATGIPSLLQCQASGIALRGKAWTIFVNGPQGVLPPGTHPITDAAMDLIVSQTQASSHVTVLPR